MGLLYDIRALEWSTYPITSYQGKPGTLSTTSNPPQVITFIVVVLYNPNINLIKTNRTVKKRIQMVRKTDQKLSFNLAIKWNL